MHVKITVTQHYMPTPEVLIECRQDGRLFVELAEQNPWDLTSTLQWMKGGGESGRSLPMNSG